MKRGAAAPESRFLLGARAPRRLLRQRAVAAACRGWVWASGAPIGPFRCLGLFVMYLGSLWATKRGRWARGARFFRERAFLELGLVRSDKLQVVVKAQG